MSIIKDYSKKYKKSPHTANHAPFFPKNIFCIIAGSTGCGKTNLIVNFLLEDGLLDYSDVYIYTSNLHQLPYEYLKEYYSELEEKIKTYYRINVKIGHFFYADDEIKDPSELDPNLHHVMVFDDVMSKDQTIIKDYFCRGRHNNANVFYLCQSIHKIAKHCIRDNANVFILFYEDEKTLKYFHETHLRNDMKFKEFQDFCNNAWTKKHGFVMINMWEEPYCGKYVTNCMDIYVPKKWLKNT
jgi:hypothetical protein